MAIVMEMKIGSATVRIADDYLRTLTPEQKAENLKRAQAVAHRIARRPEVDKQLERWNAMTLEEKNAELDKRLGKPDSIWRAQFEGDIPPSMR